MLAGMWFALALAAMLAADGGAPAAAAAGAAPVAWKEIFSLPKDDKRFFISVWASDDDQRVVAVGSGVIAQRKAGGAFEAIQLQEKHALYDAWGPGADDVIAVGWRQLIMHFVDGKWVTERSPQPGNPRQLLLYSVGPYFRDTIVAYGPGPEGMKRVAGVWQPFTRADQQTIRLRIGMDERWNKHYQAGTAMREAMRDGRGWVVCNDRRVLIQRGEKFEARGRAPKSCLSGRGVNGAEMFKDDLFLLCGQEVWRNRGETWEHEIAPEKVDALYATPGSLYAVGRRSIMKRS